jgi:hypothetical protein
MNIGQSTKIALLKIKKTQIWLAGEIGTTSVQANRICNGKTANSKTIERLANVFSMSCSDFIALGE